jgi:hypothetical protein
MVAMNAHLSQRLLQRAAEIAGGVDVLSHHLDAPVHALRLWLEGKATPPPWITALAIDIVLEDDVARAGQDRRHSPRAGAPLSLDGDARRRSSTA